MARKTRTNKTTTPETIAPVAIEARVITPHVVIETLPETPAPAEKKVRRTIVPIGYQQAYGRKGHCGDWLATQLEGVGRDKDGKMVIDEWVQLFSDNGLDLTAKWANSAHTPGWEGRYRMSGRLQLEKAVLRVGALVNLDGTVTDAPNDWLAEMATKHPKVQCEWAE